MALVTADSATRIQTPAWGHSLESCKPPPPPTASILNANDSCVRSWKAEVAGEHVCVRRRPKAEAAEECKSPRPAGDVGGDVEGRKGTACASLGRMGRGKVARGGRAFRLIVRGVFWKDTGSLGHASLGHVP